MKKNEHGNLTNDAVSLCLAFYNNGGRPRVKYITQDIRFLDTSTLLYANSETPYYLYTESVLTSISNKDGTAIPHKFSAIADYIKLQEDPVVRVSFDYKKVVQFLLKNSPSFRTYYEYENGTHEVWLKNFRFDKKTRTLRLSPYGKCAFSLKKEPGFESKVNYTAILVQLVVEGGEIGTQIKKIFRYFLEHYKKKISKKNIEAMMTNINKKRFESCFNKARVKLKMMGDTTKSVKLSIIPLKQTQKSK